jgi:hypothetical protein
MNPHTPLHLQLNAFDPSQADRKVHGTVSRGSAPAMRFMLGTPPKGERQLMAPVAPPDLCDWTHPKVGWGLVAAESLSSLPEPISRLVSARNAPVFHYRHSSEHRFALLRDTARGIDVDITSAARGMAKGELPYYLLIYGGPEVVPWRLQYVLNATRCVGRLPFEGEQLANYVAALTNNFADEPADPYTSVTWAADHGAEDITRLMRTQIALRVHREFKRDPEIGDRAIFLDGATKVEDGLGERLIDVVQARRPGLIITTSHGQTGPSLDPGEMARKLGVPVDQTNLALDVNALVKSWEPSGAVWYCHACCSAGSDSPSVFEPLFSETTDVGRLLRAVAGLGPRVAPLPLALLGAKRPLRAFIGHVEPTFDWTLQNPVSSLYSVALFL